MFKFLRKHRKVLLLTVGSCIVVALVFGAGSSFFFSSPVDTIAKINGKKLSKFDFDRLFDQATRQRTDITADERKKLVSEVFNELIRREVMAQEAQKFGIRVTDQELQVYLASLPAFQNEGRFDPGLYYRTVTQIFNMTPKQFEKQRRKDIAARKVNQLIASSVHVDDGVFEQAYQQVLMLEPDPEKKKQLRENPLGFRFQLRQQEANRVFQDWLGQLNTNLEVTVESEEFRKRLAGEI